MASLLQFMAPRVALAELQPAPQPAGAQWTYLLGGTLRGWAVLCSHQGRADSPAAPWPFPGGLSSSRSGSHAGVHSAGLSFPALLLRRLQGSSSFAKAQAQPAAQPRLW